MARVNGMPVRVLRTGISGELGYELHGSADDANEIWSAITPGAPKQFRRGPVGGSFVPANGFTDYFRKPGELGWSPHGKVPPHDFLGREALVADAASGGPARVLTGLAWDAADVTGVLAALLGDGGIPEQMDIPRRLGPSFDQVLATGKPVGMSTGRALSPHLRAMISLCVMDREYAIPGHQTVVVWGRPGTPQREIQATVAALPFKPDHRRVDVTTL